MKKYRHISALALAAALAFTAGSASAQVDSTKKDSAAVRSQTPPSSQDRANAGARPAGAITDSAIIAMLQLSHAQEITAAELATQRAQSERVKRFAERLKAEHGSALTELQEYAERMKGGVGAGVPDSARVGRDTNVTGRPDSAMVVPNAVPRDSATTGRDPNAAVGRPDSVAVQQRPDSVAVQPPPAGNELPEVNFENLPSLSGHEFDHGFIRLQVTHHETEINHLRNDVIPMIKDSGLKALVQRQLPILGAHLREAREIDAFLKTTK